MSTAKKSGKDQKLRDFAGWSFTIALLLFMFSTFMVLKYWFKINLLEIIGKSIGGGGGAAV